MCYRARAFIRAIPFWLLALSGLAAGAVGGEFADLEGRVAGEPGDLRARRALAEAYAARGFVEESVAQYAAILGAEPEDAGARTQAEILLNRRMPRWLSADTPAAALFEHACYDLRTEGGIYRFLGTTARFAAHEGERFDGVHEWRFPSVEYGYVWEAAAARWELRARCHTGEGIAPETADKVLAAVLVFHGLVRSHLNCDPTRVRRRPIDVWVTQEGPRGARAVGTDIYAYAAHVPRPPEEWLRVLAHEYGHVSFPGIGGFEATDDAYADGYLAELLLPKWLAAATVPQGMPWPVEGWQAEARAKRAALMAAAEGELDEERLRGSDRAARDYFLGLALRTEERCGSRRLGEALKQSAGGGARQFAVAVRALAPDASTAPARAE